MGVVCNKFFDMFSVYCEECLVAKSQGTLLNNMQDGTEWSRWKFQRFNCKQLAILQRDVLHEAILHKQKVRTNKYYANTTLILIN